MKRELEISIFRRHSGDQPRDVIIVSRPDGAKETYHDLDAVPADLRPLVEPLLEQLDGGPGRPRAGHAAPALDLPEETPARPRRKLARHRARRKGKSLVIEHYWFEFLVVAGALLFFLFPLYICRDEFLGRQPWTVGTGIKLALAAGGAYLTLAFLINRTTLTVTRQGIAIRHGPIPWYGSRFLPAADLLQLYVQVHGGRHTAYSLCAQTRSAQEFLISHANDARALRQYEEQIEQFLGIEDWPISGTQFR